MGLARQAQQVLAVEGLGLPPVTSEGLLLGLAALGIGIGAGFLLERLVRVWLRWRGHGRSAVAVFGRLVFWALVVLGVAAALTVVFPSVRPVNILGGLGVVSIAAGIAFQTVLGNMFAGIVILARGRFLVGDQLHVRDVRGQVDAIDLTTTTIRSFEGHKVLIPNQVMHSELVAVQTGFEQVRTTVPIEIDARADPAFAQQVAVTAMRQVPEVMTEPAPEALLTGLAGGALALDLRFWSGARQLETREAQHAVIAAVVRALAEHQVPLASSTHLIEAGESLTAALRSQP